MEVKSPWAQLLLSVKNAMNNYWLMTYLHGAYEIYQSNNMYQLKSHLETNGQQKYWRFIVYAEEEKLPKLYSLNVSSNARNKAREEFAP